MRALAKEPSARYASAVDMANALTNVRATLDHHSTLPRGVSLRSSIETGLSTRETKKIPIYKARPGVAFAGGGAVVVAALGIAIYVFATRSKVAKASLPDVTVAPSVTKPSSPPAQVPAVASPTAPAAETAAAPKTTASAGNADQTKTAKNETPAPTAEELSLLSSLQASAAEQRRRANDAGATPEQLKPGDDHSAAAFAATRRRKISEAASELNHASAAWLKAERDARNAAALAAKTRVADAPPPKKDVVPPPTQVTQSAPSPQPVSAPAPSAALPPKPVNPSVEIDAVVAAYARAIESRDVLEVRRAYPGATSAQLNGFDEFFKTLRSMRVSFTVSGLDVRGDVADARLIGAYDYVTNAGKSERQPLNIQASFRRDVAGWKLVSVR